MAVHDELSEVQKAIADIKLGINCIIGALSCQPSFDHKNFAAETKKYLDVLIAEPNPNPIAADIVLGATEHVDFIKMMNG